MTQPSIPDRTFIDDLGRQWEWCGGQPGTWAWRITGLTDEARKTISVDRIQDVIVAALNALGALLIGPSFTPIESSPIPDADIEAMLDDIDQENRQ